MPRHSLYLAVTQELPSGTLLTALPGDAERDEVSVPPSRVTHLGGHPRASSPGGLAGTSAPLPGAGSFPCQDRLLLPPPLPQRAGYSTLIPSAGCRGKGIFILALGSGRTSPLLFLAGWFFHLPNSGGSPHGPGAAEGGQGCSAVPSSPSIYLCIHHCSSSLQHPLHWPSPAIPPCLSLLELWE